MRIEKSWGYELILENDQYCMKLLVYTRPVASSLHYHPKKRETFYVTSGLFEIDHGEQGNAMTYRPGMHLTIPAGLAHRVRCLEPGTIVEASTHDDSEDCVRLVPSES